MKKPVKLIKHLCNVIYLSAVVFLIISIAAWALVIAWTLWANTVYDNPYDFRFDELPSHFNDYVFIFISLVLGPIFYCVINWGYVVPLIKVYYAIEQIGSGDYKIRIRPSGFKSVRKMINKVNDAAKELETVENMRNDLSNHISHELKTPIVSIAGFARLLKNKNTPENERDEYINIIAHEADRLSKLTSNVLTLTRLENTTILKDVERFNVTEQLRRVILLLEQKWAARNITVDFDCKEYEIPGNPSMVEQIWINLIDNAVKFTPDGGKISINVQPVGDMLTVRISDEGCGMTEEAQKHAFEKFYQDDLSHKSSGNGIGLSVVKRACELHKGEVEIIKSDANGTTFEVRLPEK